MGDPMGEWYIIPYAAMGKRQTLHFTAGSKRAKWARYREAWELLRVVEIRACVDPEFEGVEIESTGESLHHGGH